MTRNDVASYLSALIDVYSLILIVYVLVSMVLAMGTRIPYSRTTSWIINFLREVSEPYLRIFRRLIPPIGPLDLSPLVGLLALQLVGGLIVRLINGG